MAIVVATSSNLLPSSGSSPASDMSPPAAAMAATATQQPSDSRASLRPSARNANCSMAQHANANASTAAEVCTKSCQVKVAP
jgi:hypothetical protein